MKALLISSLALVVIFTGCATVPGGRTPTLEQRFAAADTDGDGRVSRGQVVDLMIEDAFKRYDTSHDGLVSEAEYLAGGGSAGVFHKINTGGTGKATLAEAKASKLIRDTMAVPFDEADVNRDGSATLAEYQSYIQRRDAAVR